MGCGCANHDPGRFFSQTHHPAATSRSVLWPSLGATVTLPSTDCLLRTIPRYGHAVLVCNLPSPMAALHPARRRLEQLVNRRTGISRASLRGVSMNKRNEPKANSGGRVASSPDQGVQPLGSWSNRSPCRTGRSLSTWDEPGVCFREPSSTLRAGQPGGDLNFR